MDWMKKCYSRLLIDNHITDLKPEHMYKFDPQNYVDMVKLSGVDSSMVYACDHNGNCYYPTEAGHQHVNLQKRDIFGEIVALLRQEKIVPIAYYTVIFHNHSAQTNPSWRMHDIAGVEHTNRYWHSCLNSKEYVDFTLKQLSEIAAYDVDGFFIDMTFWPKVCCCANCRKRYLETTGRELPEVIDWEDPVWVAYQRMREDWLAGFAQIITKHLKKIKANASVTHQFSPVIAGWFLGQSAGIANASDYASGDFYGDKYQHRLGTKMFTAFSKEMPYEFMSSRCVDLKDHTSSKSEDELFLHAGTTLANGGAYFFIDAINPDGTLNKSVYEMFGRIDKRLKPFKELISSHQPTLAADCVLYFSMSSLVDQKDSGIHLRKFAESGSNMDARDNPVVAELTGVSVILNRMKMPYRVATKPEQISGAKTLIVNNCGYLSKEEVSSIREFVQEGGTLIATGLTSLFNLNGDSTGDLALADVFGVNYTGEITDPYNYIALENNDYISNNLPVPCVKEFTATVLNRIALTDYPCNDATEYASIHSNPPGKISDFAGITINQYGKGQCIYIASSFMRLRQHSQQLFAESLFEKYINPPQVTASPLPACVELTVLKSSTQNSLLVGLVNYQEELPAVSINHPIDITIKLPQGFCPQNVTLSSAKQNINFAVENEVLKFTLPDLELLEIIEINSK